MEEGGHGIQNPIETALWSKIRRLVLWLVGYVRDQVRSLRRRWEFTAALAARQAGHATEARLHAAVPSVRLARILGGDEGATFAREAEAYFTMEKVRSAEWMTAFLSPWP